MLEVLVAFALLALGLGLLLAIMSDGVHSIAASSQSTQASLYAQSLMTTLGSDRRLAPGHTQGTFDKGRYRWAMDIRPFKPPAASTANDQGTSHSASTGQPAQYADPNAQPMVENVLLDVVLTVQWGTHAAQSLRVETLRAYVAEPVISP